ncbi:MAG: hypothetical protein AB8H12_22920 [Lewinella sp.]
MTGLQLPSLGFRSDAQIQCQFDQAPGSRAVFRIAKVLRHLYLKAVRLVIVDRRDNRLIERVLLNLHILPVNEYSEKNQHQ